MKPSVIILAYNSELTIAQTIRSVLPITDDVSIVDSFSKDSTRAIAESLGAKVVEHAFENYGSQRNWSIDNCPVRYAWQLHLDADERLTSGLAAEIAALPENPPETGFILPRMLMFLNHPIRHWRHVPQLAHAAVSQRHGAVRDAQVRSALLRNLRRYAPAEARHD